MQVDGFTVGDELGRGGFGSVYRAFDEAHGREVAIKILPLANDGARRRFSRERRAMGSVSTHPQIATVYTSGLTESGDAFLAMELVTGGSLSDRLASGPMEVPQAVTIGLGIAEALGAAHQAGVFHLDVKPENVLLTESGDLRLVDFGIAAIQGDPAATTSVFGTPAYSAPEFLDGQPAHPTADVYGMAATLYALLAGHPPYGEREGSTPVQMLYRSVAEPVPPLPRDDVPTELVELLDRSLAKDPNARPQTIGSFSEELARVPQPDDTVPLDDPSTGLIDDKEPAAQPQTVVVSAEELPGVRQTDSAQPLGAPPTRSIHDQAANEPAPVETLPPLSPDTGSKRKLVLGGAAIGLFALIAGGAAIALAINGGNESPAETTEASAMAETTTSTSEGTSPETTELTSTPTSETPPPTTRTTTSETTTPTTAPTTTPTTATPPPATAPTTTPTTATPPPSTAPATAPTTATPPPTTAPTTTTSPPTTRATTTTTVSTVAVPDFLGLRLNAATTLADSRNVRIDWPAHCNDIVTTQSPGPGTAITPDSVVTLELVPCTPNLVGFRLPAARQLADTDDRLQVTWQAHCDDLIIGQNPAANSPAVNENEIVRGQPVVINVQLQLVPC